MLNSLNDYKITFVTPVQENNGVLKPKFRQVYSSIPIRITIPRDSPTKLPPNPKILATGFVAKVHYGTGCHCNNVIETFGLSSVVDSDGFRDIRSSHMSKWIAFKERTSRYRHFMSDSRYADAIKDGFNKNDGGNDRKTFTSGLEMSMKVSTSKTGIVEVRNAVFHVPGVYKIAFELQFVSGQVIGWTPWQTVEVQRVRI